MLSGKTKKSVEIDAVIYPVCACGQPWNTHGSCGGYVPLNPIVNLGTVSYNSPKLLANLLWKLECLIKTIRRKVG